MRRLLLIAAAGTLLGSPALAQPLPRATPGPPPVAERPPAPAIKSGDVVVDRDGVQVGQVKTLTESERGALVVVEIDGKLVGVPQATLKLDGDRAVSTQSKSQMLAAAGAAG